MLVSVVIPVFNRKVFIKECLDSVINQELNALFEIIVVDDGSSDGTVEILKTYSKNVKLYFNKTNQGVSNARNKGISMAEGEYIAMIDSDCRADKQWLNNIIKPFISDPTIMIVGGKVNDTVTNYWQMVNKGLATFVQHESGYVKRVIGCNMALRRKFALTNAYDSRITLAAGDDTELFWRCFALNYKVFFTKEAQIWHYHRSSLRDSVIQQFLYGYIDVYTSLKYKKFLCINYGCRLLLGVIFFLFLEFFGFRISPTLFSASFLIFSLFPLYHSIRSGSKNLFEIIVTYPGNYLLYLSLCVGSFSYFFSFEYLIVKEQKVKI